MKIIIIKFLIYSYEVTRFKKINLLIYQFKNSLEELNINKLPILLTNKSIIA